MADKILLGILQVFAILNCYFGMRYLSSFDYSWFLYVYDVLWFLLGFISSLMGLTGMIFSRVFGEQDWKTQWTIQHHYLFAWLAIVVGYPCIVTHSWMAYNSSPIAHVHAALSAIPLVAWMRKKNVMIAKSTIIAVAMAFLSHFYICYLAGDSWGVVAAASMGLNLVSLSVPVRYSFWDITAREAFVAGVGFSTFIFTMTVGRILTNDNYESQTEGLAPKLKRGILSFFSSDGSNEVGYNQCPDGQDCS
ncbi:Glycine--tRNA ligase beta subunit [Orchesella cincta]|uniref:Glycine--tRNA ligase beta subunit n=1 Tax=Orchesella cincta TaxID=48709 RepID=A0A1D2MUD1_ORCCI|nr:Glycine--tRNA ligase beta subunit [Orchesella cincta]